MTCISISDLPLPESVKNFYIRNGISSLYPSQSEVIRSGLLEGHNIVAAISTASGKTLLAELAMLKSIMDPDRPGKALYIVPLRALASEKYQRFKEFEHIIKPNGQNISVGISTGDLNVPGNFLYKHDIIVCTSEKVDSLLRFGFSWLSELTVIIVDEIHLLDSVDRGPTLEFIITKLMQKKLQVIALSATVGNIRVVAAWLSARLVISDWRPVTLKEGVYCKDTIYFKDAQQPLFSFYKDPVISLAIDTIKQSGQCIIFDNSRRNVEAQTRRFTDFIIPYLTAKQLNSLKSLADDFRETSEVPSTEIHAQYIEQGVAYHHAGLVTEQRKLIESGFKQQLIKVIVATPTLAVGINLPARRVIIKNYKRHHALYGSCNIPVLEYKQMAGRAGRPGYDLHGESIVISNNLHEVQEITRTFIKGSSENIYSKLSSGGVLQTHILSLITSGYARSLQELQSFLGNTFFAQQQPTSNLDKIIQDVVSFLVTSKMIVEKDGLFSTKYGELVSKLYLKPSTANGIVQDLSKITQNNLTYNEFMLFNIVLSHASSALLYVKARELPALSDVILEHHCNLFHVPASNSIHYEPYCAQVKTACFLLDWLHEMKIKDLMAKYSIGEGDIDRFVDLAVRLLLAASELSRYYKLPMTSKLVQLKDCIQHGVLPELLPLCSIKGLGRSKARKLYTVKIKSFSDLKQADSQTVKKILGLSLYEKIIMKD